MQHNRKVIPDNMDRAVCSREPCDPILALARERVGGVVNDNLAGINQRLDERIGHKTASAVAHAVANIVCPWSKFARITSC